DGARCDRAGADFRAAEWAAAGARAGDAVHFTRPGGGGAGCGSGGGDAAGRTCGTGSGEGVVSDTAASVYAATARCCADDEDGPSVTSGIRATGFVSLRD